MKTECFSMVWDRGLRSKSHASKKVCENLRLFYVFFARRTFAMGPRLAQALKNQENTMIVITFYTQIKKAQWFSLLFGALDDLDDLNGLARLTGLTGLSGLTGLLVDRRSNLKK